MNEIRLKKHGNMVRVHDVESSRIIIKVLRQYAKLYGDKSLTATADALEQGIKDSAKPRK